MITSGIVLIGKLLKQASIVFDVIIRCAQSHRGWRKSNIGKNYRREFLLPRRKVVKVVKRGAISGVLCQIGRDHMYE